MNQKTQDQTSDVDPSASLPCYLSIGFEPCEGGDSDCDQCGQVAALWFGDQCYWDSREGNCLCARCLDDRVAANDAFEKEIATWSQPTDAAELVRCPPMPDGYEFVSSSPQYEYSDLLLLALRIIATSLWMPQPNTKPIPGQKRITYQYR